MNTDSALYSMCREAFMTITIHTKAHTVNSPNCGRFGTQASVLYSESVPYSGVRVISSPIYVVITVIMLFDIKASRDLFRGYNVSLFNINGLYRDSRW